MVESSNPSGHAIVGGDANNTRRRVRSQQEPPGQLARRIVFGPDLALPPLRRGKPAASKLRPGTLRPRSDPEPGRRVIRGNRNPGPQAPGKIGRNVLAAGWQIPQATLPSLGNQTPPERPFTESSTVERSRPPTGPEGSRAVRSAPRLLKQRPSRRSRPESGPILGVRKQPICVECLESRSCTYRCPDCGSRLTGPMN